MNAIRRGEWASLHKKVKPCIGTRYVFGVGMVGTETCVTEGDLACSKRDRNLFGNLRHKGETEGAGAARSQSGP